VATVKTTELLMRCPECGQTCGMKVDTSDLTSVECAECGEAFDPQEAAEQLAAAADRWRRFGDWLRAAGQV
jgi:hypothetical protein